jgi:alpha-galactosidase
MLKIIITFISTPQAAILGQKPQMGWNSWNRFHCDINSTIIEGAADAVISLGLKDLGYNYINIDDCWQAKERASNGHVVPDPTKFPNMTAVGDYIHGKGLKFGIYSSAGTKTCGGYPGGLGHEVDDANDYASWGVDYLKYDNCFNLGVAATKRYGDMANALNATGREIFYSICNWGDEQVAEWGNTMANSWRTT